MKETGLGLCPMVNICIHAVAHFGCATRELVGMPAFMINCL
jgi:hypothetical protein